MKHLLVILSLILTGGFAPVSANEDSFAEAFGEICLLHQSNFDGVLENFVSSGWDVEQGGGPGEYGAYKTNTNVYFLTANSGNSPFCAVSDETVALTRAIFLLEQKLDSYFPGNVEKGNDTGPYWRLYSDEGFSTFRIWEEMDGSALEFEFTAE